MLEKLTDPRFAAISRPSQEAVALLKRVMETTPEPVVCEIGIGIGATTQELCRNLGNRGELWIFDFEEKVEELVSDLRSAGYSNVRSVGNSHRPGDSYGWTLATFLRRARARAGAPFGGLFDFVYLDGAHAFQHDAPATVSVKELLKPGGYLLMDDYDWTFAISPSLRPSKSPSILKEYTEEQIELSHVEMVCSLLLDCDPQFEIVPIGYRGREHRRAYRKADRVETNVSATGPSAPSPV